jgi:c-di-GMP-binding flagellar brake protein YcgR
MPLVLLQTDYGAIAGSGSNVLYFILGIVGVAVLIFIAVLVNRSRSSAGNMEQALYSGVQFRRNAKAMGLAGPHADLLQNLVLASKVKQPFLVFSSAGLLDDVLRRGIYAIDNSRSLPEEEKERQKAVLFEIKQIIESNVKKAGTLSSTQLLKPGQPLTVTPETGGHFPSRVVSNMKDFLTVASPVGGGKGPERWARGTKLSVYLWRENDAGYSFPSKVLGYDTVKGVPCVLIQHGKALRREQRRRNRRKPIMRACFFYPIKIVESGQGRKSEKKAVIENHLRALGTVVDLSAGGCAIQAMSPFEPGVLIMIEFDIDKKAAIRAFGKVQRARRLMGRGGIMHVMFTRVTRQYLNRIRAFVYDFSRLAPGAAAVEAPPPHERPSAPSAPASRPPRPQR